MAAEVTITEEPQGEMLRRWFAPLLQHGSQWCAPNLKTRFAFARCGDIELPLTINEQDWGNSWICSPYNHYVTYAADEIRSAMGAAVALPTGLALRAVGVWLRQAQFNHVVMVNNWLMSTNPWPPWDAQGLPQLLDTLRKRWPQHALVFRSLNDQADALLLKALQDQGVRLIPSRQIWWFDPDSRAVRKSPSLKRDLRLLRGNDLEQVPHEALKPTDFQQLTKLHHDLYLKKHSQHNPAYTVDWLRYCWEQHLLHYIALRQPKGQLIGVEARANIHGTIVSPVVGYDLEQPQRLGLYRRLAALPVLAAREERLPLNLSAGVGAYKSARGGQPVMEYLAVDHAHLPTSRQTPWKVIEWVSQTMLAPVVRRLGL